MRTPREISAYAAQYTQPLSVETVRLQPADAQTLCCPNCGSTDTLELIEQVVIVVPIIEARDVGVTLPELDLTEYDGELVTQRPTTTLGVRCSNCRWGYEGPAPFSRLVTVGLVG